MKIKEILLELKESFTPYAPLWQQWKDYEFSCLTRQEIYRLDAHILSNFRYDPIIILSYNKIEDIQQLALKLKNCYPAFQRWAILTEQLSCIHNLKKEVATNTVQVHV